KRWVREAHERRVVEPDDRELTGNSDPGPAGRADDAERHDVARADDTGGAALQETVPCSLSALHGEDATLDEVDVVSVRPAELFEGGQLARGGHVVLGPEHHTDALVPERAKMDECLLDSTTVVDRDAREAEIVVCRVDQHGRQPALP